jgi:hypothetical protein
MTREEEIEIIKLYLKNDVINTSKTYTNLLEKTIIENGILINNYNKELEQIKLSKNNKSD